MFAENLKRLEEERLLKEKLFENDQLNGKIENQVTSNNLLDVLVTVRSCKVNNIRPGIALMLFEKLFEARTPNFYFEVLKYMIEEKYTDLNKLIFKKFFILCGKSHRLDYASHVYSIYILNMQDTLGYSAKIANISIYYTTFLIFCD